MIGQKAKLVDGREVTIVGFIEWSDKNDSYRPRIRYIYTTFGNLNKEGKRIDTMRSPENVVLYK